MHEQRYPAGADRVYHLLPRLKSKIRSTRSRNELDFSSPFAVTRYINKARPHTRYCVPILHAHTQRIMRAHYACIGRSLANGDPSEDKFESLALASDYDYGAVDARASTHAQTHTRQFESLSLSLSLSRSLRCSSVYPHANLRVRANRAIADSSGSRGSDRIRSGGGSVLFAIAPRVYECKLKMLVERAPLSARESIGLISRLTLGLLLLLYQADARRRRLHCSVNVYRSPCRTGRFSSGSAFPEHVW